MRGVVWWMGFLVACTSQAEAPKKGPVAAVEEAKAPAEEVAPKASPSLTMGPFSITPVYHATTIIEHQGTVFWLDPWSKADLAGKPKADVILITDIHFDHLDEDAIAAVSKEGTVVVAPQAVADKRKEAGKAVDHVLKNRQSLTLSGVEITAVPMYNLVRGPEEGKFYHEQGRGDGYVLRSGETRVYFAGDTECVPEIKALSDIDLAFLPMNLPYTMPPEEAAACVQAFKPSVVVPYHYAGSDLGAFSTPLDGLEGVRVRVLDYYPGGLPW